jgi:DNA-binding MarR family transcriptional regulator
MSQLPTEGARLGAELGTAVVLFHEAVAGRLGLSAADYRALGLINRHGPLTAGRLAEETGLSPGAVTGLIDRLDRAGQVRRVGDPADRRRTLVAAVAAPGDSAELFAGLGRAMSELMARYDAAEMAVITDYVTRSVEVLRAETRKLSAGDSAGS